MIFSYDYGHGTGQDRGAKGILDEEKEIRRYAPYCINMLMRAGHTCVNCTPENENLSLMDSLSYRVNKANASNSQLHLCFHVNAFNGTAQGSEIEVASDAGAKYGLSILNEICKLGFNNRGIKRPDLYITKHTNMTACLIEPFFCDNKTDCGIYEPQKLGEAIAKGVLNISKGNYTPPSIKTPPENNDIPQQGDNITLLNGGGWIERVKDGRTILHQSRTVYLSLTKDGHLDFTNLNGNKRIV